MVSWVRIGSARKFCTFPGSKRNWISGRASVAYLCNNTCSFLVILSEIVLGLKHNADLKSSWVRKAPLTGLQPFLDISVNLVVVCYG